MKNWIKHDWFRLICDMAVLKLVYVDNINATTFFLVVYTIVVTIIHYERYWEYRR